MMQKFCSEVFLQNLFKPIQNLIQKDKYILMFLRPGNNLSANKRWMYKEIMMYHYNRILLNYQKIEIMLLLQYVEL